MDLAASKIEAPLSIAATQPDSNQNTQPSCGEAVLRNTEFGDLLIANFEIFYFQGGL